MYFVKRILQISAHTDFVQSFQFIHVYEFKQNRIIE